MKRKIDTFKSWHWGDSKGNVLELLRKDKVVFEAKKFYEITVGEEMLKLIKSIRSIGHLTTVEFSRGVLAEIDERNKAIEVKLSEWL